MMKRLFRLIALVVVSLLPLTLIVRAQGNPDTRFSIVVIPDTQYLFDQDRGDSEPLKATMQWIIDHTKEYNIVFTAQLGDIVENALPEEFAQADAVFKMLDDKKIPYSYLAGNHDHSDSGKYDNETNDESYLNLFSPKRVSSNPSFGGASENGLNMYFTFQAAGQDWLLFALDWQASIGTLEWAQKVIDAHPSMPVIVTTHQLVDDDGSGTGTGVVTAYGQYLWNNLISKNDQIFLTLNGHYWPPARTTRMNALGHRVDMHLTNYQDRYYGGEGMMRLYQFDLVQNTIDVSTFSPWVMAKTQPNALDIPQLLDPADHFTMQINFAERFSGFNGVKPGVIAALPTEKQVIDGTVAYWHFSGKAGDPVATEGVAISDLSGKGNDLTRVNLANGQSTDLVYSSEYAPAQPTHGSIFLNGSYRNPSFGGAYLRTADDAPLNSLTFEKGYTIEAFLRLPADCCGSQHAWMGVLSRMGTGGDIAQTEGDADEPVTQFAISPGRQLQWAIRTTNGQDILTNWSHEIEANVWRHVAIINDGKQTVMYIDGAKIGRNPRAESIGLATAGKYWVIGGGHYANLVEQSFYGWLGDIRIVDRPLSPDEWMTAR